MAAVPDQLAVAIQHHQAGRLRAAEQIYQQILQAHPNQPDALHLLGVIARQSGRHEVAVEYIGCAIKQKANVAEYHNNLGGAYLDLRRIPAAVASFRQAVKIKPDYVLAQCNLGNALKEQGNLDEAVNCCRKALKLKPDYVEAHVNLGNVYLEQGKLDEAVASYHRALRINSDFVLAHNNLGNVLKIQGKLDEAMAAYHRAITLKPDFSEAFNNLGNVLNARGNRDEAEVCFRRAIELNPRYAEAYSNLANVFRDDGKPDEAIVCYRNALVLLPDYAPAHNNLGNVLKDQGKLEEAITCYDRALELAPDDFEVYNNRGNAYQDQGNLEAAMVNYRRALAIKPDFSKAHSNLLVSLQYCDGVSLASLYEAHAEFDRHHAAKWLPITLPQEGQGGNFVADRPLRLGFVSADLGRHPVGYFLVRILECLCHEPCETFCYSDRMNKDDLTERIQSVVTQWRDIAGSSDDRLAQQIRADQIDVLFDLAGHSAHHRMLVFARKPAPIQVTWAGYMGTTGLKAMDFILADRHEIPSVSEQHYQERVLLMPDGYVCYDPPAYAPEVNRLPAYECGHVTFGCFNNPAKVTARAIEIWSQILKLVPQSRLVLKYKGWSDAGVARRCSEQFARTIDPSRVEFLGYSPHAELLAEYHHIDLALDPFPYSGGLTTCEALWMGVPVVTCPFETFASRHSLSHLSNVGLTETIATDLDQYVKLAAGLASDLPRLSEIRSSLRDRVAASPLCDGKRFAANLVQLLSQLCRDKRSHFDAPI